jgi:transposase
LTSLLAEVGSEDLWRGELALELEALAHLETQVAAVEAKLDRLAEAAAEERRYPAVNKRGHGLVSCWLRGVGYSSKRLPAIGEPPS